MHLSTYVSGIGGDSLTIRHGDDLNEIDAPGRLCGDLSDWVPLNATIHITYADLNKQGYNIFNERLKFRTYKVHTIFFYSYCKKCLHIITSFII